MHPAVTKVAAHLVKTKHNQTLFWVPELWRTIRCSPSPPARLLTPSISLRRALLRANTDNVVVQRRWEEGAHLLTSGERAAGKPLLERQGRIYEWGEIEAEGTLVQRHEGTKESDALRELEPVFQEHWGLQTGLGRWAAAKSGGGLCTLQRRLILAQGLKIRA